MLFPGHYIEARSIMITDPLFYRLFETSPQTFFLLLGLPAESAGEMASRYQFEAIEFKQTSQRTDGVFQPKEPDLPLYFVEVQFYREPRVFAGILAKSFTYLKQHDPGQEFVSVVVFAGRGLEPAQVKPYKPYLDAGILRCFYLDEMEEPANAPVSISVLYLIRQAESEAAARARDLIVRVKTEIADEGLRHDLIELISTVILYKLPELSRKEIEAMLQVHDIRESRVFKEALEEGMEKGEKKGMEKGMEKGIEIGMEEGIEKGMERGIEKGRMELAELAVPLLAANKMTAEEIADKLSLDIEEVRKLLTNTDKK